MEYLFFTLPRPTQYEVDCASKHLKLDDSLLYTVQKYDSRRGFVWDETGADRLSPNKLRLKVGSLSEAKLLVDNASERMRVVKLSRYLTSDYLPAAVSVLYVRSEAE